MKGTEVLKLSKGEIEIIRRLGDEIYNVEFFSGFLDSGDTEETDAEAMGFLRAVQKAAGADLHIFPKAYARMLGNLENAAGNFAALSELCKTQMNNAEDLFIMDGET